MSQRVYEVRNRFDATPNNHGLSDFRVDSIHPDCLEVIGLSDGIDNIVNLLLEPNVQREVSILPILGMRVTSKTTVAQLIYNDPRIQKEFSLRLWTCVSDKDHQTLGNVRNIIIKILQSATGKKYGDFLGKNFNELEVELRKLLDGRKFLLVLDDVSNEDCFTWLYLMKFFKGGVRGSSILVTTSFKRTAIALGDDYMYELKGLLEKEESCVFWRVALPAKNYYLEVYKDWVETWYRISERCSNVFPLVPRHNKQNPSFKLDPDNPFLYTQRITEETCSDIDAQDVQQGSPCFNSRSTSKTLIRKATLKWVFMLLNVFIEVCQGTITQEASQGTLGRQIYLKLSIITSAFCLIMSLVEALHEGWRSKVKRQSGRWFCWPYYNVEERKLFGRFSLYFGIVCSTVQFVINLTTMVTNKDSIKFDYVPLLLSVGYMAAEMVGLHENQVVVCPNCNLVNSA